MSVGSLSKKKDIFLSAGLVEIWESGNLACSKHIDHVAMHDSKNKEDKLDGDGDVS